LFGSLKRAAQLLMWVFSGALEGAASRLVGCPHNAIEIVPSMSVLTTLHENLPASSHCKWLNVVFPVHAVKAYMRSRGIIPLILNVYPFGGGYLNFHESRSVRG